MAHTAIFTLYCTVWRRCPRHCDSVKVVPLLSDWGIYCASRLSSKVEKGPKECLSPHWDQGYLVLPFRILGQWRLKKYAYIVCEVLKLLKISKPFQTIETWQRFLYCDGRQYTDAHGVMNYLDTWVLGTRCCLATSHNVGAVSKNIKDCSRWSIMFDCQYVIPSLYYNSTGVWKEGVAITACSIKSFQGVPKAFTWLYPKFFDTFAALYLLICGQLRSPLWDNGKGLVSFGWVHER